MSYFPLFNNLNEYSAVGGASPSWNNDGGLSSYGGNTYIYDSLMRLTQVSNATGLYLFSYDPLGRRVKKVIESPSGTVLETYSYHYDSSEVAVEYQPSATWTYYLGLGIDQPVMRINGTTKQWYYADAQGSISAVADNSGDVLEEYEYNPQGHCQVFNASGTVQTGTMIGNSILYTGRSYDAETGNYFYRARYYNPYLGRFISRDPLSGAEFSQGTNLYAYVENDFLNRVDPTGMDALTDAATQHFENEGYPSWVAAGIVATGSFAINHHSALETTNNVLMVAQMFDGAGEVEAGAEKLIDAASLTGKTRTEIGELADSKGLKPFGDKSSPDYPRKWQDDSGQERIRLDRGHTDPKTGKPFDNPNAAADHVHGYNADGSKITVGGDPHIPTTGE